LKHYDGDNDGEIVRADAVVALLDALEDDKVTVGEAMAVAEVVANGGQINVACPGCLQSSFPVSFASDPVGSSIYIDGIKF